MEVYMLKSAEATGPQGVYNIKTKNQIQESVTNTELPGNRNTGF